MLSVFYFAAILHAVPFYIFCDIELTKMNNWLFLLPVIGAMIGWMISWIAVKSLYQPRLPRKILGITFHGFIYRKQAQLAAKAGQLGSGLFAGLDIEHQVNDPDNLAGVMPMIDKHVDDFLKNKLTKEMPVLSMFIGDKTIATLKKTFMQEIEILLPQVISGFAGNLKMKLNPAQIIQQKIAEIPAGKLEQIFTRQLSAELRYIRLLGMLIGFIIGVVQLAITFLLS